jgi:spermidine/putrescine transport system permease protein
VQARRSAFDPRPWAFAAPALLWTVAFFVVPFAAMALVSLREGTGESAGWTLASYARFFERGHFLEALANSLEVTLLVTVVSVVLAYPLAWILAERVPPRWQRLALVLAVLPFWTSYVVRSYAWLLVLASNGIVNQFLEAVGLISEPLRLANTRAATVIGFVHFFVMLLTLTIYANLVQLPPNYRRAAADLGAGRIATFVHVVLPLTLPGVMVGAFLTFVLCIGDYVTPQILGGNQELLMPQLIMLQIGRRADFPTASALSIVLMAVVTVAYIACARWLKLERA